MPLICGAREEYDRLRQLPLNPADIQGTGIRAGRLRIGEDSRFIFERNVMRVRSSKGFHGDSFGVPGLAAIKRAANVDAITSRVVRPVITGSKLVEGQIAQVACPLLSKAVETSPATFQPDGAVPVARSNVTAPSLE